MIALVTDSNAQLPAELLERYGVTVVPLTVTVDGVEHEEGVDLDADGFYARFEGDSRPTVSTSQPSPGRFLQAYRAAAEAGATAVLSVHIGAAVSGTVDSARLAAGTSPVPVRVVDTGTASFGVGCCVWEAGEVLRAGGTLDDAAGAAEALAPRIGNVFVVGALDLVRAGGRLARGVEAQAEAEGVAAVPVLTLVDGEVRVVGTAADTAAAADVMAAQVLAAGDGLRVAVGIADTAAEPLWRALEVQLAESSQVADLVRYRVGPSVGAHTGPGTAGAFFYRSGPLPSIVPPA